MNIYKSNFYSFGVRSWLHIIIHFLSARFVSGAMKQHQRSHPLRQQTFFIEPLISTIKESYSTIQSTDNQISSDIIISLSDAEREISDCKKATLNMIDLSKEIGDKILPSSNSLFTDMQRIFRVIDTIEDTIIPSLNGDLLELETLVGYIERQNSRRGRGAQHQQHGNISVNIKANLSKLLKSSSNDSYDSRDSHGSSNNNDGFETDEPPPDCLLTNPKTLVKLLAPPK